MIDFKEHPYNVLQLAIDVARPEHKTSEKEFNNLYVEFLTYNTGIEGDITGSDEPDQYSRALKDEASGDTLIYRRISEVTEEWVTDQIGQLDVDNVLEDQDWRAFGITCRIGKMDEDQNFTPTMFLPAADLKVFDPEKDRGLFDASSLMSKTGINIPPEIFKTDASYHVYWPVLLPWNCLPKFMGLLLLTNYRREKKEYVDQRWIGFAGARNKLDLRWSRKSASKSHPPELWHEPKPPPALLEDD